MKNSWNPIKPTAYKNVLTKEDMNPKELHKTAPRLAQISGKGNGFTVPEGYFDTLEDQLLSPQSATNLAPPSKQAVFSVPEGYFECLEKEVLKKAGIQPRPVLTHRNPGKMWWAMAAAAAVLISFLINVETLDNNDFTALTSDEIEAWFSEEQTEIETDYLASLFDEDSLDNHRVLSDVSDEEVIDYLGEQDLDKLLLTNEN